MKKLILSLMIFNMVILSARKEEDKIMASIDYTIASYSRFSKDYTKAYYVPCTLDYSPYLSK